MGVGMNGNAKAHSRVFGPSRPVAQIYAEQVVADRILGMIGGISR